jgi:hypothetical protein
MAVDGKIGRLRPRSSGGRLQGGSHGRRHAALIVRMFFSSPAEEFSKPAER